MDVANKKRVEKKLLELQIRAFVLTWVSYASFYFTRKNLAVTKSRLHEQLGVTTALLGTLDTAYLITYALGQLISGVLGDRLGPRRLLTLGMLGSAATAVGFGLSSTVLPMFLAFALNGFFQSAGWPGNVKAMQPFFGSAARGRVMGLWTTNYQVGGLLATTFATLLLAHSGWRAAFWVPALWVAVVGFTIYAFLIEKPEDCGLPPIDNLHAASLHPSHADVAAQPPSVGFFELLREPLILALGGAYFGLKLIRYSLLFWLPFYLRQYFHYSESLAGYLSLPFEVGGIVGSVAIGWLSDRYFRTQRLRLATPAIFLLGGALFAYQSLGGLSLLGNALLLSGVGFLLFGPDALISGTVSQEIGGSHATGRVAGLINGIGSIGAVFSPLLVAWVSVHLGWNALFFGFVGVTVIAGLLLGLAQVLQIRPLALSAAKKTR